MSMELAGGELSFAEAAARCPFLQSLGEQALAEIEVEYEVSRQAAEDTPKEIIADVQPKPDVVSAEMGAPAARLRPVALRSAFAPDTVVTQPSFIQDQEPQKSEQAAVLLPPETLLQPPLLTSGDEQAAVVYTDTPWQESMSHIKIEPVPMPPPCIESVPVTIGLVSEMPQIQVVSAEKAAPEVGGEPTASSVVRAEYEELPAEVRAEEQPIARIIPVEAVVVSETAMDMPVSLEALLVEPPVFAETTPQLAGESANTPEAEGEATLFSAQLEAIVTATVEPERQQAVQAHIVAIYELVEQMIGEPGVPENLSVRNISEEVAEAVRTLLQELDVTEPTDQQIIRFVEYMGQERAHSRRATTREVVLDLFRERNQGVSSPRWSMWALGKFSLHRHLARLALA